MSEATMVRVGGSSRSFRCDAGDDCGCNVFTKTPDPEHGTVYRCNACGTEYAGSR